MATKNPTKPEPAAKYNAVTVPELLYQLSKASQQGEPASFYLKAAAKRPELLAAIAAYCPSAIGSPRKFGDSLRPLANQQHEHCGETLTLKSRFVNRKHETQWAVDGSLRMRILKAREVANFREEQVQATAREAAKLLRSGKSLAELESITGKPAVAAPTANHSAEALRISRERGWDPPVQPAGHFTARDAPVQPAPPVPAVLEEAPRAPAPVVDTTGWPPAWLIHGKPDYSPGPRREEPDEHYKNDEARRRYGKGDGVELASVVFDPRHPRNQRKQEE